MEIWCDRFPVLSETFVANEARALVALGYDVTVRAAKRGDAPEAAAGLTVRYQEDDTRAQRLTALARVLVRHPAASARDLASRRRWRREEEVVPLRVLAPAILRRPRHIHAHFAAGAALDALRVARFTRRPWTLTAHAYDIYQRPRNLPEKLRAAALTTSGCEYTVADLRRMAPGARVERLVMGVDPEEFRRSRPPGETILAVGRLVEKKGFVHLVRAAAEPALANRRIRIVGEGPERARLEAEIARLSVQDRVELAGALPPAAVRAQLEDAAVLAMPCVIAADGDRDSQPVVVKEALAMEVPVVASDAVGLPEIIRPEFGRLVPPGDHAALAAALAELLALPPETRAAMGRAGRAFVAEHADVHRETRRLSELLRRVSRAA